MKIAIFVPDLRGGGVERVRLLLAREFLAKGHSVDLVLLRKRGILLRQVPPQVTIIDLQVSRARNVIIPLGRYLRQYRPDALLASMWPLTTLAALAAALTRFRGRVVLSEHSTLTHAIRGNSLLGLGLRLSMRWINPRADAVVAVSQGVLQDLHALGLPENAGEVIYNPVSISPETEVPTTWAVHPWFGYPRGKRLLAVGSLKAAKDYPTLLSAVRKVIDSGTDVSLLILGAGPLLSELEKNRRALGLESDVHFGGFVLDPGPFYRAAGLFVLSSAWEGFGNVLAEALAAGTPVVSTNCCSGPAEILGNGCYGRLVSGGDDAALAKAIDESLVDDYDSDALRMRAADFGSKRIAEKYLMVLCS